MLSIAYAVLGFISLAIAAYCFYMAYKIMQQKKNDSGRKDSGQQHLLF